MTCRRPRCRPVGRCTRGLARFGSSACCAGRCTRGRPGLGHRVREVARAAPRPPARLRAVRLPERRLRRRGRLHGAARGSGCRSTDHAVRAALVLPRRRGALRDVPGAERAVRRPRRAGRHRCRHPGHERLHRRQQRCRLAGPPAPGDPAGRAQHVPAAAQLARVLRRGLHRRVQARGDPLRRRLAADRLAHGAQPERFGGARRRDGDVRAGGRVDDPGDGPRAAGVHPAAVLGRARALARAGREGRPRRGVVPPVLHSNAGQRRGLLRRTRVPRRT